MIGRLISNTISGAIVGYVTNDLAIKMLFEKKFGLGGVILETREEFIENISKLVEREVINHHTIGKELSRSPERFEKSLHKLTTHFFDHELLNAVPPGFKITDIPQVATSFDAMQNHLMEVIHGFAPPLTDFLLAHLSIEDVLSAEQRNLLSQRLSVQLPEALGKTEGLTEVLRATYPHVGEMKISDLIPEEVILKLSTNLFGTHPLHLTLKNHFNETITGSIGTVLSALQTDALITKLAGSIAEKKLQDLIGKESTNHLSGELIRRLQHIIESKEGEEILQTFAHFLLAALEKEETTVFGLLSEDLARNFEKFLRKRLPAVISSVIAWLQDRGQQLEQLIDETFRANIDSKLKSWILGFFVQSVSQSADVVQQMINILEQHRKDPADTSARLTQQIVTFLKSNTIGSIVRQLKKTNTGQQLGTLLQKGIRQAIQNLNVGKTAHFFDKTIGELVPQEEIEKFLRNTLQKLINQELKDRTLYQEKFSTTAEGELNRQVLSLIHQPIHQLIKQPLFNKGVDLLPRQLVKIAHRQQTTVKDYLNALIEQQTTGKNGQQLLASLRLQSLAPLILHPLDAAVRHQFDLIKQHELKPYLQKLTAYQSPVPDYLKTAIVGNLPMLLQGNIEQLVRWRMQGMGTGQLKDIVEKFMGTELQPITVLGAILGAAAGAGLFTMNYLPGMDNFWISLGASGLAYGITGYGTNWLALKMIFRPRREKRVLGIRVPFTPGVLAKNQARFAGNMGNFVGDHLLNSTILKESFESQKSIMASHFQQAFSRDDYSALRHLLHQNQAVIADKTALFVMELLDQNRDRMEQTLSEWVEKRGSTHLSSLESAALEKMVMDYSRGSAVTGKIEQALQKGLQHLSRQPLSLSQFLPDHMEGDVTETLTDLIRKHLSDLAGQVKDPGKVNRFIARFEPAFQTHSRLNLNHYLKDSQKDFLHDSLSKFLQSKLIDQEIRQLVYNFIDEKLAEELNPERQIGTLFGGKLIALIGDNLDVVADKMIRYALEWLSMNKIELADKVYRKALETTKAAFFYEKAIMNTIYELADEGIPAFFEEEKLSLKKLIADGVVQIGENRLHELDIRLDQNYLKNLVSDFVSRPEMLASIGRLAGMLLNEVFKVPLSVFLQVTGIHSLDDLKKIVQPELEIALDHLHSRSTEQQEVIAAELASLGSRLMSHHLERWKLSDLMRGISEAQQQEIARRLTTALWALPAVQQAKELLIAGFFETLKNYEFREVADMEVLKKDVMSTFEKLIRKPETREFMHAQLVDLLNKLLAGAPDHISAETKDFLVQSFVKTALGAVEANLNEVVEIIDLKKIVIDELKAMEVEEIEKLFYSFADQYFTKLINYGFGFGVAFGWASDLVIYGIMKAAGLEFDT